MVDSEMAPGYLTASDLSLQKIVELLGVAIFCAAGFPRSLPPAARCRAGGSNGHGCRKRNNTSGIQGGAEYRATRELAT